ncbi:Uncharacterised protein [Chlamydia trachomatis]|nr:Uncharacterised protein [Chlamydia trachomatis]
MISFAAMIIPKEIPNKELMQNREKEGVSMMAKKFMSIAR